MQSRVHLTPVLHRSYVPRAMAKGSSSKGKAKGGRDSGIQVIVKNRRAHFDFEIVKRFEAGMELLGSEVKSLRDGAVSLSDAYAFPEKDGQLFLRNAHIAPYKASGAALNHDPLRTRRLLLHRRELEEIAIAIREKGLTVVPLSIYFKNGRAKAEIALARGKTHGDRRQTIVEREQKREIDRALRGAKKFGR